MKTTQPVRDIVELKKIKKYYREVKPNKRNFLLIICGLNTALRISDILKLRDRKSTRLNSSHNVAYRMPSSA